MLEACRLEARSTSRYHHLALGSALNGWPFPVALTRHRLLHTRIPLEHLNRLIDHFDSLVRYTCIADSCARQQVLNIPTNPGPSLGWWVTKLTELSLEGEHRAALASAAKIAQQNEIVKLRNELRGHGYTLSASMIAEKNIHLEKAIQQIETVLEPFLIRHIPVLVESFSPDAGSTAKFVGLKLAGSNTIFHKYERVRSISTLSTIPNQNDLLLETEHGFVSFGEHLVRRHCPSCKQDRILISDGSVYIDLEVGHRVSFR